MSVVCLNPRDRAEWLELRRADVTGTETAAVLGIHPWMTPFEVYEAKCGRAIDRPATAAMQSGTELEPIAFERVRRHFSPANVLTNEGPRFYYRDTARRHGVTPDCLVSDSARGLGVVEVKTTDEWNFNKHWLTDGVIEPPLYAAVQVLTQANIIPAVEWAAIAVLRLTRPLKFDIIDVPLHAGAWERIKTAVADFWALVDAGTPPPPDYNRDGRLIASLYPVDTGAELDLSGDNEFVH